MNFLSERLANGRRFRVFTSVDNFSRVSPAKEVEFSWTGNRGGANTIGGLNSTLQVLADIIFDRTAAMRCRKFCSPNQAKLSYFAANALRVKVTVSKLECVICSCNLLFIQNARSALVGGACPHLLCKVLFWPPQFWSVARWQTQIPRSVHHHHKHLKARRILMRFYPAWSARLAQ